MQLAAALLETPATLAQIAGDVGYGSEAAFSRAFKKIVGVAPRPGAPRAAAHAPLAEAASAPLHIWTLGKTSRTPGKAGIVPRSHDGHHRMTRSSE